MGIDVKDSIEIFAEGDSIILRRYEAGCVFCGEARDTVMLHGKRVCGKCREQLLASGPIGGA